MDADAALQELGSDAIGQAFVTATVTVWDDDPRVADEKLRLVEKVIQGRDFTCMAESVNAVEAWLGSLPGHVYANVRQPPVSTLNLAHMIPLSAVWAGPARDEHFDAPPLFFAQDRGLDPVPLLASCRRCRPYAGGGSDRRRQVGAAGADGAAVPPLCRMPRSSPSTSAARSAPRRSPWVATGTISAARCPTMPAEPVALQPLALIDDAAERAWAAEWIANILARENDRHHAGSEGSSLVGAASLASAPIAERTLTGLSVLLQSQTLKRALQPYCLGGPYGRLLDAEAERLGEADVQAFETEGLIGTAAAPAVLAYLFHRIEGRLDGRPTLLIVDEGWLALDDEGFAGQLREWLKTLRKKNASVIFATQSLSDIDGSAIAPAIIESCPTRLFLPNERAIEPQITAIYRRFGLNDRQIEILARATPKRDYYCQSRRGNRLFELGLGEVALAFTAASSKSDQAAIEQVLAEHGRDGFVAAWLRTAASAWAADLIPNLPAGGSSS